MDIRFLKTFLEVAETRHFGRAAENLFLTQSAVSARIKLLEEYFSTPLFIRNRNKIQITPAGEKLIPFAQSLNSGLEQARKALSEESCSHVRCASTPSAMLLFFAKVFPEIFLKFPHISISYDVATYERITRELHEHTIEFALTTVPLKSDDIKSQVICHCELALYSSSVNQDKQVNGLSNFIQLDWTPTINEQLKKQFPDLTRSKLITSSTTMAFSLLQKMPARAILPALRNKFIDNELKASLRNLTEQPLPQEIKIPVYLHSLKTAKNKAIDEIFTYLLSQSK